MKLQFNLSILFILLLSTIAYSQPRPDTTYFRVINERATKIVKNLEISDTAKFRKVQHIVAEQYINLGLVYDTRDSRIRKIKSDSTLTKEMRSMQIKNQENEAFSNLYMLHFDYISKLMIELDNRQIEKIKDEMTYNVAPRTFQSYIDMLPKLTSEQKSVIYAWLIEAREFAMDAESSEKKHALFGKYKGRINNYLSKEGYNLKKEGDEWQKRIKTQEGEKK